MGLQPGDLVMLVGRDIMSMWSELGSYATSRGVCLEWVDTPEELLTTLAIVETSDQNAANPSSWALVVRHRTGTVGWVHLGLKCVRVSWCFKKIEAPRRETKPW